MEICPKLTHRRHLTSPVSELVSIPKPQGLRRS